MTTTYRFSGTVLDQTSRLGLPDMRVEAWDAEAKSADLIAFAVTGRGGTFTITLDQDDLTEHFHGRSLLLAFRVFGLFGESGAGPIGRSWGQGKRRENRSPPAAIGGTPIEP